MDNNNDNIHGQDANGDDADIKNNGNLTDFVYGVTDDNPLRIEVGIAEDGRVILFHNKVFKTNLSWLEFDLDSSKLDFILGEGETRGIATPVDRSVSKHMQNTHQVLTVLLDDDTGEAKEGTYIPLILHRA